MTWRRPGDKVLPLETRLANLERQTNLLLVSTLVLVGLHLNELGPVAGVVTHLAGAIQRVGLG